MRSTEQLNLFIPPSRTVLAQRQALANVDTSVYSDFPRVSASLAVLVWGLLLVRLFSEGVSFPLRAPPNSLYWIEGHSKCLNISYDTIGRIKVLDFLNGSPGLSSIS